MRDSQGHYRRLLKSTRCGLQSEHLVLIYLEISLIDCEKANRAWHFWGSSLHCLLWMFSLTLQSLHQASLYPPQKKITKSAS